MRRRAYLGLLAAATAGCLGGPREADAPGTTSDGGSTTTATPGDLATLSAGDFRLTITDVLVRASVVAVTTSGTHLGVFDEPDTQYLVVGVQNHGAGPIEDIPLSVVLDGERVAAEFRSVGGPPSRRLAFAVPVREASEAAVILAAGDETDRWSLPDDTRSELARTPAFTVTDLTVPDRIDHGHDFEASFTVRNDGDRGGRFLFELGHTLISDTAERQVNVARGETRTVETGIDPPWGEPVDEIPVVLDWGLDRRRATVAVDGTPTPSPRAERSTESDESRSDTASSTPAVATTEREATPSTRDS